MSVEKITINSKEMERVVDFVHKLAKDMVFDDTMESRNWGKARRRNNMLYSVLPAKKGTKFNKIQTGSVKSLKVTWDNPAEDKIIIYIHGGGFVTGSAFAKKSYCSTLAKASGYRVFAPEYDLAPEYKFPKGFEDCCETFEWILEKYPNAKISLIGESAGGNLCLALALKYKDTGKIANVSVHSPIVDFTGTVDHSINEKKDFIVKSGSTPALIRMYVGDAEVNSPYISPILGDYTNFPPLFITCDANETLYADSVELYKKAEAAGVKVDMIEVTGSFHAFGVTGTSAPEASELFEKNIEFMKS